MAAAAVAPMPSCALPRAPAAMGHSPGPSSLSMSQFEKVEMVQRVMKGVREEMMLAMLAHLQSAAQECATICDERLFDLCAEISRSERDASSEARRSPRPPTICLSGMKDSSTPPQKPVVRTATEAEVKAFDIASCMGDDTEEEEEEEEEHPCGSETLQQQMGGVAASPGVVGQPLFGTPAAAAGSSSSRGSRAPRARSVPLLTPRQDKREERRQARADATGCGEREETPEELVRAIMEKHDYEPHRAARARRLRRSRLSIPLSQVPLTSEVDLVGQGESSSSASAAAYSAKRRGNRKLLSGSALGDWGRVCGIGAHDGPPRTGPLVPLTVLHEAASESGSTSVTGSVVGSTTPSLAGGDSMEQTAATTLNWPVSSVAPAHGCGIR